MELKRKINKTVLIFEDIDTVFPDEKGFYSGVMKCIENSKVPIILTSHLPFKNWEIIKKWEKKGIKIKEIKRNKTHISALKIKIRLHLIILFEWVINKYMKEYFELDKENLEKENYLDIDNLGAWDEELIYEEFWSQYSYISALLKQMNFNLLKILSLLSMQSWENIINSINNWKYKPFLITKRNDILFQQQLFSTSNPNITLENEIFNSILPDIESSSNCMKDQGSSTDSATKTEANDFDTLHYYQQFISNMSEFCYLQTKQLNYEENTTSKNIFDIDLTNVNEINKPENSNVIDEYFVGKWKWNSKLEKNSKIKKSQKQIIEDVEKNLKSSDANENNCSRLTLDTFPGKPVNLPYFCLIWKEEKLQSEKTKLNSTTCMHNSLREAAYFYHWNLSLLYSHIKE